MSKIQESSRQTYKSLRGTSPSVAMAMSFCKGKWLFATTNINASFRSHPRVLSFSNTISRSSSLTTQSSDTVRTNADNKVYPVHGMSHPKWCSNTHTAKVMMAVAIQCHCSGLRFCVLLCGVKAAGQPFSSADSHSLVTGLKSHQWDMYRLSFRVGLFHMGYVPGHIIGG